MYIWSTEDTALGRQGAELTSSFVSGEYRYEVLKVSTIGLQKLLLTTQHCNA